EYVYDHRGDERATLAPPQTPPRRAAGVCVHQAPGRGSALARLALLDLACNDRRPTTRKEHRAADRERVAYIQSRCTGNIAWDMGTTRRFESKGREKVTPAFELAPIAVRWVSK